MGFADAKRLLLSALEAGNYEHEARDVLAEKNRLAVGEVTEDELIAVLKRATGRDYTTSRHHWDPYVEVHTFRPIKEGVRWYIKAYELEAGGGRVVFISVHQ